MSKEIGGILDKKNKKDYKTGSWRFKKPIWHKEKCIQCMMCYNYCPENCILAKKDKKGNIVRENINYDYCKGCGICAKVCPVNAIEMVDE